MTLSNLVSNEIRLWMMLMLFYGGWYLSYTTLCPQDNILAAGVGMVACICLGLLSEYTSEAKRCFKARISARLAQFPQKNSAILQLPNEMQFEIAEFLTAEDLLVVRATCRKINNVLKGESARFWLHTRLRRCIRDFSNPVDSTCDHHTGVSMLSQARMLVFDAVVLLTSKIIGIRDPVQILRSTKENDCVLKWVYLNADWIRKQKLPPLEEGDGDNNSFVILTPGDVAFNVFYNMISKASLGIILNYDDDFNVESIEVPKHIYVMLQRDPFSFMAAETLSAPAMPNSYLALVVFAAMTLIFMVQCTRDLILTAYPSDLGVEVIL